VLNSTYFPKQFFSLTGVNAVSMDFINLNLIPFWSG